MANINEMLDNALKTKDTQGVRDTLITFIMQDEGFSKGIFDEKVAYCLHHGISEAELFTAYDGAVLNTNAGEWTEAYYSSLKTKLRANFSRERLEHLRKVGKKLFPSSVATGSGQKSGRTVSKSGSGSRWMILAVIVVVIVAFVIWMCSKTAPSIPSVG
jgi:hypothetical protein